MYKIFSKVLANRLKKILPQIIIEHWSAFTESRLILNNILVSFESLNSILKHSGMDDFMAIKLDISKIYDKVDWVYLEVVIRKLSFCDQWIKLIMPCVCLFRPHKPDYLT